MTFTAPLFLLLLLTLPLLIWLGWPSRGPSRAREWLSLGLRLLIALLLIGGLSGLELKRPSNKLSVVFLVDHSDSIPAEARQVELNYVREALQHMKSADKAAVILFGGDALVERPFSNNRDTDAFTSKVISIQTDLAEAIRLGLALLPADSARRMVILSDGIQTTGDALEAARLAATGGVQVLIVPFQMQRGTEALITSVNAPPHLREGEEFGLEVTIEATTDQNVSVRVLSGTAIAYEGALQLRRGTNSFTLPLTAGTPGFSAYRVVITPLDDIFYQNNELAAFSQVAGPPKVLLVKNLNPRDGVDETKELIAALEASNILTEIVPPSGLPSELAALSEYASVILVDVPARDLRPRQMTALQTYVRDLGGGLVAVGGPSAFGVGGYFKTPLEDTLPVEMQIKDQKRRPRLAILFVIDHSGSMSETSGGVEKIELAKEAAIRAIELLNPTDKVGVIAFDDSAKWVVPITTLDDPDSVINAIGTIRSDGGTDIMAGVRAASEKFPEDDSTVKHIILLTDGIADPTGIPALVSDMYETYGITFSSVAVGQGADVDLLKKLADAGGGLYHFTDDPSSIPSIFTEEVTLATRAYIIEEEFFPQQVSPSPILSGIESVPKLLGYIGTTSKESAQTILISAQKDPVLAAWQYGLGKSVAWTSDATGRWAKNWVTWDHFARFWAQIVRYTINEGLASDVQAHIKHEGEQATLSVDAQSDSGEYLNGLTMQANVVGPDGQTQTITLQQVAPGRYSGTFSPTTEGAYLIRVAGSEPGQPADAQAAVAQTAGWVLSYSPEYQTLAADPNFLLRLATITGGGVVGEDLSIIFKHDLPVPRAATQPVWPLLFLLAVLLFPLDIAVRRLVVTRYDVERGWQRVAGWLTLSAPQPSSVPAERAEQLSSLFKAKSRAGTETQPAPIPSASVKTPPPIVTNPSLPPSAANAETPPPVITQPPRPESAKEPPISQPPTAPAPTGSTSAALLAAKKRAREKKE